MLLLYVYIYIYIILLYNPVLLADYVSTQNWLNGWSLKKSIRSSKAR